ncbi:CDP-diacylglycerol--glycerol-3-phosphate 3-phosphatidyltransferase [Mycoplasmopsis synoviae]|uniref:CDP-diacylglycerol--glycerol-3-phosphate 3-phosphatidyltransferase n=1 Tax=Mycoplasmopsis synoviae TaxID=2109 RepID=A0A3B0PUW3_MYCSY|nr:CDP-diacylglycerol--glycerol-3-phosphate 3-phosphatidyltransferase [Mycoplasmopsis synoviae]
MVLIVVRDLLVDGHRVAMAQKNIEVSASIFGKIKTIVVSLGIVMVLMLNLIFVDLIQSNISSGNVAGAKQYLPYINPNLRSYLGQALNTLPVPNVDMPNNDVLRTSELLHNFLNVNTVDLADNTKYILVTNLALLLGMLTSLLSGGIYLADFYRKNKS